MKAAHARIDLALAATALLLTVSSTDGFSVHGPHCSSFQRTSSIDKRQTIACYMKTRTTDSPKQSSSTARQAQPPEPSAFSFPSLWSSSNDNSADQRRADMVSELQEQQQEEPFHRTEHFIPKMAGIGFSLLAIGGILFVLMNQVSLPSPVETIHAAEDFFQDPNTALQQVVTSVQDMGPTGLLYFGLIYTFAEILAIPAIPLTASAGYLFGTIQGTAVVLVSASIAAAISFVIGRTLLRSYVEEALQEFPRFQRVDAAIGREGFKLMLLLRLSPIFPFALSNYLYGASSVGFVDYFFGTMLGFTPGTIAYVLSGHVGKALTIGADVGGGSGSSMVQPWYVYAGGLVVLGGLLKIVADLATNIIEEIEEGDEI